MVAARAVATVLFCGAVAFGSGAVPSAAAAPKPVTVPVVVHGGQGTAGGARPTVEVRVGNSAAVPVVLDTGSSGLHIFANALDTGAASGVTVTSNPANITYAGGHRFVGVVANARIHIGEQATAGPVPFALVERAVCVPEKPACPAAHGIAGIERGGTYGILGIGTQRSKGPVASPILGLPGALANTWSIHLHGHEGELVFGAPAARADSIAVTVHMARAGTWDGHSLWADSRLPMCLTVDTIRACVPALLDTGTYAVQLWGPALAGAPTDQGTRRVSIGTSIAVASPGTVQPFWSFRAGIARSQDLVTVRGGPRDFVNAGVQPYFDFVVTYDGAAGTVTLST